MRDGIESSMGYKTVAPASRRCRTAPDTGETPNAINLKSLII
jgi:hypothetical protein